MINTLQNNANDKYTIICTQFQFGQITEVKDKLEVRNECEKLKKMFSNKRLCDLDIYVRIEIINNNTGEIREYWNNKENTIKF